MASVQRETKCVSRPVSDVKLRLCLLLAQCCQFIQDIPHLFLSLRQRQAASYNGPKLCEVIKMSDSCQRV